ncbi:MAG: sulfite exporter TauE/SafE family protein [Deltaproteobacteria bacterium]|nr:sulfite exporter TauE/SafE family protein [Deltaproteobacteria bacterium]
MFETIFLKVNELMTSGSSIAALGCFLWGVISVMFSPCHLASIPLIVGYVGGQEAMLTPRKAGIYSVLFSTGLFISIALVGIICAILGRMLGDIGNYWQVVIGLVLIWIALGMIGVEKCSASGSLLYKLNFRGFIGAFGLGLAYGILSGSCTFGFIAPILAIITVQEKIATGILFIILFAIGHCLPIVFAGSFTGFVKSIMDNSRWQGAGSWFRKGAGVVILLLAIYFIVNPFLGA